MVTSFTCLASILLAIGVSGPLTVLAVDASAGGMGGIFVDMLSRTRVRVMSAVMIA